MRGLEFAINDIGLAVFTALSPAGALAFVAMAGVLMFGRLSEEERRRFEGWLIIPLALVMLGLVASTTHLGTPSNALYVLNRAGRSPLSTEVVIAVVFLGLACTYWYSSIYSKKMGPIRRVWLAVAAAAGLLFLWGTTQAYMYDTVVTWTQTPAWANITLTAVGAFPPLATLMLAVSGQHRRRVLVKALCCVGVAGVAASTAVLVAVYLDICVLYNAYGCARGLVPAFIPVTVVYAVVTAAADVASCTLALRYDRLHGGTEEATEVPEGQERRILGSMTLCCVLTLAAALAVRFEFYCMHMTTGMV